MGGGEGISPGKCNLTKVDLPRVEPWSNAGAIAMTTFRWADPARALFKHIKETEAGKARLAAQVCS